LFLFYGFSISHLLPEEVSMSRKRFAPHFCSAHEGVPFSSSEDTWRKGRARPLPPVFPDSDS
jgi:hypothetical protein